MSLVVHWFNRYFLSEKPNGAVIADLEWDLNPQTTIRKLKEYKPTRNEILQYSTCTFFLTCAFFLNPLHILIKVAFTSLLITLFLIPLTSQFFFNALPILTWVLFFFSSSKIPFAYRPPISVKVLPAMETILYGDNLSQLLATSTTPVLDILAWLPYGMIHFGLPFVVAGLLFLWGPPTSLRSFAFAFGFMNLTGVVIQLIFPAAAPWYKIIHGLDPANYSMLGSPGGLARIDTLLHLDLYTTNFSKNSPVVFGAFPSLHSGSATMDALFLSYLFPKLTPLFVVYVMWLWWSTMYLTHHYFIDLMAGSFLSFIVFQYTKYRHLPINEKTAKNRWSYADIRKANIWKSDPLSNFMENDVENQVITRSRSRSIQQRQSYEMAVLGQRQRLGSLTSNNNSTSSLAPPSTSSSTQLPPLTPHNSIPTIALPNLIPSTVPEDSDSSPETSVFDNDVPRSYSRASNTSNTSVESQYDLSVPPTKSRRD